ncbi:MAG TPA: metal ABC transporter permease, partial [Chlamydiales bacterium]|nr:metal ABC transporter permease [Chlamydiales bacterium]
MHLLDYFQDPVLQAPAFGSLLMALTSAIVGTFLVLGRKSLLGEVLSHSLYPGVIIALFVSSLLFHPENGGGFQEIGELLGVIVAAFATSLLAIRFLNFQQQTLRVSHDAAQTVTLASFFAIGLLLFSGLQNDFPILGRKLNATVFGQTATMRSIHLISYGALTVLVLATVSIFFRSIEATLFDSSFAAFSGICTRRIENLLFSLTILAICIGIRSTGVVLVSAMLVFPAAAARRLSNNLKVVLVLAAIIGMLSGFFGLVIAHESATVLSKP